MAETYDNIGSTYSSRNDFNRALEYHEKALNIKMRVLGSNDDNDNDNDDHGDDDDDLNSDVDDLCRCFMRVMVIRMMIGI